jgi:uncharacterized protein YdiU (UPF0061 family)
MGGRNRTRPSFLRTAMLLAALLSLPALAGPWEDASEGQSSFVNLGPDYSVPVPVQRVRGARLVLLNQGLAERLGLSGTDLAQVEKLILERFAITTNVNGSSKWHMFATRYLDYARKSLEELGNPQGDGRAVWAGEQQIKLADGRILYLDFSLKGSGRTPLARAVLDRGGEKGLNTQYSDGLQSMEEAVRGFIASNTLARNGLESVQDLAVIELPIQKAIGKSGNTAKAALTVRVGTQTRMGHLEYFTEEPEKFRKLFEYTVKRDLGLPLDAVVTDKVVGDYFLQLGGNTGKESAVYLDNNWLHGSLTRGNQTTKGVPIDFGTFEAMDAFHGEHKYLYERLFTKNQSKDIYDYVERAYTMAKNAGFQSSVSLEQVKKEFTHTYTEKLTDLRLQRLGLTEEQIAALPANLKSEFFNTTEKLALMPGKKPMEFYLGKIKPAAFDLRNILRESLKVAETGAASTDPAWVNALIPKTSWNTLSESDLTKVPQGFKKAPKNAIYTEMARDYVASVVAIQKQLKNSGADLSAAVERATAISSQARPEAIFPSVEALMQAVRDPSRNFRENSRDAAKIVEALSDLPGKDEINHSMAHAHPGMPETGKGSAECPGRFSSLARKILPFWK